jgi:hypothetical protein
VRGSASHRRDGVREFLRGPRWRFAPGLCR